MEVIEYHPQDFYFCSFWGYSSSTTQTQSLRRFTKWSLSESIFGEFFFDATCARIPKKAVKLQSQDLLLPAANVNQIAAVETVLATPDLALIQGPPGTGKTTVIAEICYQVALRGGRTLIASQANLAVDNALSRLVHNPVIRAVRKGKAEKVQEEGEPFLEDRVIDTWLKNTANDCENDLDERLQRVEILRNLLIESERFNAYVELEEVWVSQQQELSDRRTILETSREVLESEVLQLETDTKELNFLRLGLDNLLNSAPNVNWQDEEIKNLLPRLQPYSQEEKSVKDLLDNVRLTRNIARDIGWEIPTLGAFGLAAWFSENLAVLLPEFQRGLTIAKKAAVIMSELANLRQIYQQTYSQFEDLKKYIIQQEIVSENLQKNRQELESQKKSNRFSYFRSRCLDKYW